MSFRVLGRTFFPLLTEAESILTFSLKLVGLVPETSLHRSQQLPTPVMVSAQPRAKKKIVSCGSDEDDFMFFFVKT